MNGQREVDFDLAGTVRVRVRGGDAEIAAVGRQLGLPSGPPEGEADIRIDVVDRVRRAGPLRLLGREEAAFDDEGYFVQRAKAKARAMVRIPFDDIGHRLTIECEPGLPAVPLLIPILAVTALGKGFVPLHAGAFTWNGTGVVVTGWSKGGKTETLLATTGAGAEYVGDEWCYLDPEHATVVGIPERVTIWAWHLRHYPAMRARVPARDRLRMAVLDAPDRVESRLPPRVQRHRVGRLLRRVAHQTRDRANTWIDPSDIYGARGVRQVPFEHVVLVVSGEGAETTLREVPASEIADRMTASVLYELGPLLEHHHMFRYAFPGRHSEALERLPTDVSRGLHRALDPRSGWILDHPYPVALEALSDALRPLVGDAEPPGGGRR